MRGLEGRSIVVAGGATGIGAATARRLAHEGANVTVGDVNEAGLRATVEAIRADGGTATGTPFDLADEASCVALIETAISTYGDVWGLFNVGADLSPANLGKDRMLLDTDWSVWHRTLEVNLLGYARTSKAVLPHLLAQGGGSIVNTTSTGSFGTDPLHLAYNVSKAGINRLTQAIATNYGRQGVRCNALAPGLVMGETQVAQTDPALQQSMLSRLPSTRLGEPDDIAASAAFLLSDDGAWVNGQVWAVNGGSMLRA